MFTPGLWRTFEKTFSVFLLKVLENYASWLRLTVKRIRSTLPYCAVTF